MGMVYSAAFCSRYTGDILYTVKGSLPYSSSGEMLRIDRHCVTVSLQELGEIIKSYLNKGLNLWAFGSPMENQFLQQLGVSAKVHDLQKQTKWALTKAEDAGFKHNAHSEVSHYFFQICMGIDPEGMTWHEARNNATKREAYNKILESKG